MEWTYMSIADIRLRTENRQGARSILDYYTDHNISPVKQDLANLTQHYERRSYLYQYLGVLPNCIRNCDVIEFGPGPAHNALYTTSLNPRRYVLVDGNERALAESKESLKNYFPKATMHEFVLSRIEEYESTDRFDLVLCEGVVTHQPNPHDFVRHVAQFTKPGGIMVITTADYVSALAETLRKLVCIQYVDKGAPITEQLVTLKRIFTPHLDTLQGMSRLYDDWVLDNMVQRWETGLFSIEEAIHCVQSDYRVLGSSPKFMTDWRWYKNIYGETARIGELTIHQYRSQFVNFIDYRVQDVTIEQNKATDLLKYCEEIYWKMIDATSEDSTRLYKQIASYCSALCDLLSVSSPITAKSLMEASLFFKMPPEDPNTIFDSFKSWFGRAQQYVSFIKL